MYVLAFQQMHSYNFQNFHNSRFTETKETGGKGWCWNSQLQSSIVSGVLSKESQDFALTKIYPPKFHPETCMIEKKYIYIYKLDPIILENI